MLMTTAMSNQVTELAVVMFGAAPGGYKSYLDEVYMNNGGDVAATAAALGQEPAFAMLHMDAAATMIANLSIDAITDVATKDLAINYINANVTTANAADQYAIALDYMKNNTDGFDFSEALAVINAKVAVANSFTNGYGENVLNLDILQSAIAGVDANTDTTAIAFDNLTSGDDVIFGDGNDNLFMAGLSQDASTLNSGDYINGGAGIDTLDITLAQTPFAIIPETTGVEIVRIQSQADGQDQGDNDPAANGVSNEQATTPNTLDAGMMMGVTQFWNNDSRADLKIEDIQTKSHETTIGIQSTDSGDVDYEVYFDNITAPNAEAAGSQLFVQVLDLENEALTNEPLKENVYTGLYFFVNGVRVNVEMDANAGDGFNDAPVTTSYADLIVAINAGLAANAATANITAAAGNAFTVSDANGNPQTGTTIVLSTSGTETLTEGGFTTGGKDVPADTNFHTAMDDVPPVTDPYLTQTNIYLDDAGQGSSMGEFLAGNMSTGGDTSNSPGIEQFNVVVNNDSWLEKMTSTNNALEVMNIENDTANGDLRLTTMTDVRVFDADAMVGSVRLDNVDLTEAVTAKYLDLQDDAVNPAADNSEIVYSGVEDKEFSYDFGAGDDTLNLDLEDDNLAAQGTLNREDFVLEVNAGAGNDTMTVRVVEDATSATDTLAANDTNNWYVNHQINGNITINGEDGDDTIMTPGAGDFVINAGAGDDTVYTDNAGAQAVITYNDGKATWVMNSVGLDIDDLDSETAASISAVNAGLVVEFMGYESSLTTIANSAGATSNVTITDLTINQAIKDAVNNDDVLSKLLEVNDGPGRTLIVTSKIDGTMAAADLSVAFAETAQTTAQAGLAPGTVAYFDPTAAAGGTATALLDGYFTAPAAVSAAGAAYNFNAQTLATQGVATAETQTITITGDDVNDADETITIALDTNGDGVVNASDATPITVNVGPIDSTDANAVAAAVNSALAGNATVSAEVLANVVTLTYNEAGTDYADAVVTVGGTVGTLDGIVLETQAGGTVATNITGADSTFASDNDTNLGTGNDVIVLGTDATGAAATASNETITFTGYENGVDTIVNFDVAGVGVDVLDFSAYIGSGVGAVVAAGPNLVDNDVHYLAFDDTVANVVAANLTFETISASNVLAALNGTAAATDLDTIVFGIDADIGAAAATPVDDEYLLVLENANNAGEYKVFHLSSTDGTSTAFTDAKLVGTYDFGDANTALDVGVDVIA